MKVFFAVFLTQNDCEIVEQEHAVDDGVEEMAQQEPEKYEEAAQTEDHSTVSSDLPSDDAIPLAQQVKHLGRQFVAF